MKTIIMATAIFFASIGFATAKTKTHHKKHHLVKHTKTTAVINKKDDNAKGNTTMKTKTDKKK